MNSLVVLRASRTMSADARERTPPRSGTEPYDGGGRGWRTQDFGGYSSYEEWQESVNSELSWRNRIPLSKSQYEIFVNFRGYVSFRGRRLLQCDWCRAWGHCQSDCYVARAAQDSGCEHWEKFTRGCMEGTPEGTNHH